MGEFDRGLKQKLKSASKVEACDVVLVNGKIVDVYTNSIIEENVAITAGKIVGIGEYTDAKEVIDVGGSYICPGLIDGHVHIESAMVRPEDFASVVLTKGVTTVIADPHEIANVAGREAVHYMLEASANLPLDIKMMMPSSVPAAVFEENGATITSADMKDSIQSERIYGLGEVMDYPAVLAGDPEMLKKIELAREMGRVVDGHGAGLSIEALNAYRVAGIENDHEAVTKEEALNRVRRGFYVLMREGTAARDIEALLPAVTEANARRFAFSTDDKHLDDLMEEGSIDFNVRKAIQLGMDPLQAIQIGTLNAAECFRLTEKGAIAPGKEATLLLVSDLHSFEVEQVYVKGELVAEAGVLTNPLRPHVPVPEFLRNSMNVKPFGADRLNLKLKNAKEAYVIEAQLGSIITKKQIEPVDSDNNLFKPGSGHLKLVVAERHKNRGTIGVGICKGLPFKKGAIVSTVAHDSHNIIACGADDESLYHAIDHVTSIGGGMAVISGNEVLASMPLQVGGLMSIEPVETVKRQLNQLQQALVKLGYTEKIDPFLTLAFLALPVIPALKLTSKGLFDVETFTFVEQ
ncbi:adenine deaminase [Alkalihalobacillus xiaoxiensis]|uniref:Adenine deaminase n=1 Tax=Shouchella xiaoxiensis TaxID=766895 RepID=A0ABS2STY0_9BACI|nr:adenine deaminase [Shouchella xiaoxiensis]MBM7839003.1 adenine deaminase [Shouchella xiaoxiensis]